MALKTPQYKLRPYRRAFALFIVSRETLVVGRSRIIEAIHFHSKVLAFSEGLEGLVKAQMLKLRK
jgi:hypothetical protein